MYINNCKDFPLYIYGEDSLKTLKNPLLSNMITIYSFYKGQEPEYISFNLFALYQPLIALLCENNGKQKIYLIICFVGLKLLIMQMKMQLFI